MWNGAPRGAVFIWAAYFFSSVADFGFGMSGARFAIVPGSVGSLQRRFSHPSSPTSTTRKPFVSTW